MYDFQILPILIIAYTLSYSGYKFLVSRQAGNIFFIRSEKSSSQARLLGGLPLAFTTILYFIYSLPNQLAMASIIPALIITGYGLYDDKFELRARLKLVFQVLSIGLFAISVAHQSSALPFITSAFLIWFFGMAMVNGANLLDGLDTMTIKTAGTILLGFATVSFLKSNAFALGLSLTLFVSLLAFYQFNKEPARLYLGEIGGSFLGLTFLILGFSNFVMFTKTHSHLGSVSYVLLICSLPINELGITFIRRIWAKKSPFRGDRLHLHHILREKHQLSASTTSSSIAFGNFFIFLITLPIAETVSPTIALIINVLLSVGAYFYFCKNAWNASKNKENENDPFRHFNNKPVFLISTKEMEDTHVKICYEHLEKQKDAA